MKTKARALISSALLYAFLIGAAAFATSSIHSAWAGPQACWGGNCVPNGIISYNGGQMFDPRLNQVRYVPWITALSRWPEYKTQIKSQFEKIHNDFHARAVRLILHVRNPAWGVGLTFPRPTPTEISYLQEIMDTAAAAELNVVWVFVLPDSYNNAMPDSLDTLYAANNVSLMWNMFQFWDAVLPPVLATSGPDGQVRANHLQFVDILGDFDPLAVFLPTGPAKTQRMQSQQAWFRALWPNFRAWHTYIPNEKKTIELIGGLNYDAANNVAVNLIVKEIEWVKAETARYGWPEPTRFSFEAYATRSWADSYPTWFDAYTDLLTKTATAAGGSTRLAIEEIGVNSGCGDPGDDGEEGRKAFSASFGAITYLMGTGQLSRDTPVGVWELNDSSSCATNGQFGLVKTDGSLKLGWWVLPYFFSN